MQQYKRIITLALTLAVASVLGSSASTLARDGGDDSVDQSNSTTTSSQTSTDGRRSHMIDDDKRAEFRQRAESEIEQKRSEMGEKKAKNAEERKNRCESHKDGLTNKFSRIVTNAKKHQARIDKFLDKATAYKDSSNLAPENWDTLLASAQAAKETSTASIADLEAITPTIDCNSDSVASDVATFKAAAQKVRDDLKAYKTSVKALLKSLRDAKQASTTTQTEGSNNETN